MMAEASRMMQTADRRDDLAVLLQRLKRTGKLVILARRGDLIVQRVDTVGEIDEGAAPRRGSLLGRVEAGSCIPASAGQMQVPIAHEEHDGGRSATIGKDSCS